jgi:hypothetical protein
VRIEDAFAGAVVVLELVLVLQTINGRQWDPTLPHRRARPAGQRRTDPGTPYLLAQADRPYAIAGDPQPEHHIGREHHWTNRGH